MKTRKMKPAPTRPTKAQIIEDLFSPKTKLAHPAIPKFNKKWGLEEDSPTKTAVYTDISLIKGEGDKIFEIAKRMAEAVLKSTPVVETARLTIKNEALNIPEEMHTLVETMIVPSESDYVDEVNKLVLKTLEP